ncbi:MAG: diacylglycerol kinase family lipid kinase [Clostridia bacterium]|nr:diacylglycerol kinase family lipid kinase [Clostridia bacterium]
MQYIFVVNPCAGRGDHAQAIRQAVEALPERADCAVYETRSAGDATRYVRDFCQTQPGPLRFIACGGDGTINEVFNGAAGFKGVSVSCYPCGSGNDFVKCFGGAEAFSDIGALLRAPARKLDLLKIGERYCVNICNFGFDTKVAVTMNKVRGRKLLGGKNAYATGVVNALLTAMKSRCTVTADGERLNEGLMLLCTVANGQYVGGAFRCAPRARCDDGLIEVCLVKPISRLTFVKLLGPYANGEHLDDPRFDRILVYRQARSVEVEAAPGFAYSLDGEIIYSDRFRIEIAPAALDFAAPAFAAEA